MPNTSIINCYLAYGSDQCPVPASQDTASPILLPKLLSWGPRLLHHCASSSSSSLLFVLLHTYLNRMKSRESSTLSLYPTSTSAWNMRGSCLGAESSRYVASSCNKAAQISTVWKGGKRHAFSIHHCVPWDLKIIRQKPNRKPPTPTLPAGMQSRVPSALSNACGWYTAALPAGKGEPGRQLTALLTAWLERRAKGRCHHQQAPGVQHKYPCNAVTSAGMLDVHCVRS